MKMEVDEDRKVVTFLLFQDIQNMKEIKEMIFNNQLHAAVVNPKYVLGPEQLLSAAHKSLYSSSTSQMKTKSIFTEVLYNLFPGKSIRDALKTFGVQENGTEAVFVVFTDGNDGLVEDIRKLVKGNNQSLKNITSFSDSESIQTLYKVPKMCHKDDVMNYIITKVASKELML